MTTTTVTPKGDPTSTTVTVRTISRAAAARLIEVSRTGAEELGLPLAIAVTDAAGHLRAFESMDHAPFLAHEVAINKAWTASAYRLPTHTWSEIIRDPALAQLAHVPRLVAVGGGFPIIEGGEVIGGLGLSGGTAQQDHSIAQQALTALEFTLPA